MASASSEVGMERSEKQLKHLGFVRVLAVNAVVLVSNLYDNAKQNLGSLRSTVDTVENAVTSAVVPVYNIIKGIPTDLLVFLDHKVDEASQKFDERASPSLKKALSKVQLLATKAAQTAHGLVEEAKVSGPLAAISHVGKIFQGFAVTRLAVVWYKVNQFPSINGVAKIAIPAVANWSEKYNQLVKDMSVKGYTIFNYVPLVPVEEFAKACKQVESSAAGKKGDDDASSSGSETESVS